MKNKPLFTTLQRIEAISATLDMRGRWIADDVNELVNLPGWETQAEDGLRLAEERLARTLQTVRQARELLKKKRQPKAA